MTATATTTTTTTTATATTVIPAYHSFEAECKSLLGRGNQTILRASKQQGTITPRTAG